MPDRPIRIVTGCKNSTPVRIVTAGGSPVRIVTTGGDPVRIVTQGVSDPVRVIGDCGIAPIYLSGEIGNVDDTTVVVTFSSDITASCSDYALGFTIYVNGVADAITAAILLASNTISFTVITAVVNGDVITISYDSAVGCVTESCGVTDLETFVGESITNNVVVSSWWLAGGAPAPIAVYQPKGAASLAASYVNLVNPGTYDAAPGVAPGWNAISGWTFVAGNWLQTGITPTSGWSAIVRYSNLGGSGDRYFIAADIAANTAFLIAINFLANTRYGNGGLNPNVSAANISGTMAIVVQQPYKNDATDGGTTAAWSGVSSTTVCIGCAGDGTNKNLNAYVQAIVIYSTVLTLAQFLAVRTAMAAL